MFVLIPFNTNKNLSNGNSFENILSNFFNDDFFAPFNIDSDNFHADIKETDNEYLVVAELPGVKKEDISLEYNDNQLVISAKRDEFINGEKDNYIRKERHYGTFSRAFYVDNVDKNDILAKFENGELKIVLPKLEKTSPSSNRIEIQ